MPRGKKNVKEEVPPVTIDTPAPAEEMQVYGEAKAGRGFHAVEVKGGFRVVNHEGQFVSGVLGREEAFILATQQESWRVRNNAGLKR